MKMPDGNGGNTRAAIIDHAIGYFWFIMLALWGGTANYVSRLKKSKAPFSIVELFGEWSISGFAGCLTILICSHYGFDTYITGALTGISGHMGGRAIFIVEQIIQKKLSSITRQ